VVPDLVGLSVEGARRVAALTWPGRYLVTAQEPEPRAVLLRWDSVVVDVRPDDGGAGDREPRRPHPALLVDRAEEDRCRPCVAVEKRFRGVRRRYPSGRARCLGGDGHGR
jgi:hypothetical protein